jgi:hypothetical protein
VERYLFSHLPMSSFRFKHLVSGSLADQEEIVIVTSKQYLAVADDFLRKLFPELTPNLVPRPGAFTVFIKDDDHALH